MADSVDSLQIEIDASAKKASAQIENLISQLGSLKSNLSGLSAKNAISISTEFTNATKTMASTTSGSRRLKSGIDALSNSLSKTRNNTTSLASAFGKFYASFFLLIRGAKSLKNAIESSMDYVETYNYFSVTMDKIGSEFSSNFQQYGYDSADAYANSFSDRLNELTTKMTGYSVGASGELTQVDTKNLSLDPQQIMSYEANISAITNSIGLAGETSIYASKAMSMLSADMSSFKNIDLSTVMTNLQSGLIGQSRALYKYGIDITNATLQTTAYQYGVSKAVAEMTQAEKMQLRILAILEQSRVAWGDQANTINSVANQYRILRQQVSNVARIIGNLFLPVIQTVLPFVNGLMISIQGLLTTLGINLFGDNWLSGIMDGISSGYSGDDLVDIGEDTSIGDTFTGITDGADDASDAIDSANAAAKKFKNTLLAFDEMNVLADNTDNSSSNSGVGSVGSVGDLGLSDLGSLPEIDLSDAIEKALADYESIWNNALNNSANKAQEWADKITGFFDEVANFIKSEDWRGMGKYFADGLNTIVDYVDDVFNWNRLGGKITKVMTGITKTLNSFVDNVKFNKIGAALGNGLNVITNTLYLWYGGIDWINIGRQLADGANGLVSSIDWNMLGRAIGAKAMKLPKILAGFIMKFNFKPAGEAVATALNGAFEEIDLGLIGQSIGRLATGVFNFFITFADKFEWKKFGKNIANGINGIIQKTSAKQFAKAISDMLNGILDLIGTIVTEIDWGAVGAGIFEFIGNLDWWAVGKAFMVVGIGKFVANTVKALGGAFTDGMKGFSLQSVFSGIATAVGTLSSGGLLEGTGAISKLANAFSLAAGGAGTLTESLSLEFPKIATLTGQIGDLFSGKVGLGTLISSSMGWSVAAIGGIGLAAAGLVAAITASRDEVKNLAFESTFTQLRETGEVSLTALGDVAIAQFTRIKDGATETTDKLSSIEESRGNIETTVESINKIQEAITLGAYTAEEKCNEISESFKSLLYETKAVASEEYSAVLDLVMTASDEALASMGYTREGLIGQLASFEGEYSGSIDGVISKLDELDEQQKQGAISADEYNRSIAELVSEYQAFNSDSRVNEASAAIEEFTGTLDFSKYMVEGGVDTTKLTSDMELVGSSAIDASTEVQEAYEADKKNAEAFLKSRGATAEEVSKLMPVLLGVAEGQLNENKAAINSAYTDYADQVQYCLLEQIPGVVDQATSDYENLSWWDKLFTTKEEYVDNAIAKFKSETVTPITDELQSSFEQLGIEGQVWATDSMDALTSSMFDEFEQQIGVGMYKQQRQLSDSWEQILDEGLKEASSRIDSEAYGQNTVDGYTKGVNDNAFSALNAIDKLGQEIDSAFHNSALDFGSPSRTMSEYGKFTVDGYINGIEDNVKNSLNTLNLWTDAIDDELRSALDDIDENVELKGRRLSTSIADGFNNNWNAISGVFSGLSSRITSAIGDLWSVGRNAMQSFANGFSSVHIPTPHFSVSKNWYTAGNAQYSLPSIGVNYYANGGFPNTGELFMARENGINEMVGRMGAKSAVANNDQITESISDAVAPAVYNATLAAMQAANTGGSDGGDIVVQIDGKEVFRAVRKANNETVKMTGQPQFLV